MNRIVILILLVTFLFIGIDFVVKHKTEHQGIGGAPVDTCENPYPELGTLSTTGGRFDFNFTVENYSDAFHFDTCEELLAIPSSTIEGAMQARYQRFLVRIEVFSDGNPSNNAIDESLTPDEEAIFQ